MMKNINTMVNVIIIVTILVFTACKKDANMLTPSHNDEMMDRNKKVLQLIKQFDEKMQSNCKSGELIELDSAIWNTEALQNYNYAIPDSAANDLSVYKFNYTINIDINNMALLDNVQVLYNNMVIDIQTILNQNRSVEGNLLFTDVALDSIDNSIAYISSTSGIGSGISNNYLPFDEDDDWIWGTLSGPLAGKCDGTEVGVSDGSNELAYRLNNPIPAGQEPIYGYTDIEWKEANGIGEDYEGRLYVDQTGTEDACLNNNQLTYYLWESDDIIYSYTNQGGERPPGKDLIRVRILDELIPGGGSTYFHNYWIWYGIPLYVPPPD